MGFTCTRCFVECSVRVMTFMFKLEFSVSCSIMSQVGFACHAGPDVTIVVGIGGNWCFDC